MALTYLNSQMIDVPLSVPTLSARTIQSPSVTATNVTVTNLSANNYYASSIFNDTNLFGNLTVSGRINALSGLNIVSTFATTTSSLSVVNTGLGRALDVTQASNVDGIASFKGNNGEVVRVNNNNPDVGQAGLAISWSGTGPALSAQGYSNFGTINANTVNSTDVVATNARINNLNVDVITRLNSISATDTVTNNIIFPPGGGNVINGTTFYGNLNVLGRITSLSAIEVISTSTTSTSALNVVNAGSTAAIYAKQLQPNTNGIVDFVGANNVSVLRVNNTLPDIGQDAVRIIHTGVGNTFVAGNSANSNSTAFVITSAGNVGIGVANPTTALQVNGSIAANTFVGNLIGNASSVTISDGSVNALKLADNAVLSNKIVDNAVISSKLALSAVTTPTINTFAVTTEKIADLSVTSGKLASNAVTVTKIADGAVTPVKLSTGGPTWDTSNNTTVGGTLSAGNVITSGSVTASTTLSSGGSLIAGSTWNQQLSSYTVRDSDCGGIVALSSASVTLSAILPNPNTLRQGYQVTILRLGAGPVVINANGNNLQQAYGLINLSSQYSAATLVYSGAPTIGWILFGDLG